MTGLEMLLTAATAALACGAAAAALLAWRWRRFMLQQSQHLQALQGELQTTRAALQREQLLHNRQLVSDKQLAQLTRLYGRIQTELGAIKLQLGPVPAPAENPVIDAIVARIHTQPADIGQSDAASLDFAIKLFQRGDYAEAHAALLPFAEEGSAVAQSLLAKLYYAGHGVARDEQRYWYWLERAAEGGDRSAKAKLKQRNRSAKGIIASSD